MTLTTLVTGCSAPARETAIASLLDGYGSTALILEGMPNGIDRFAPIGHAKKLQIARIAPGCVCCTGNLTMRVTLNRILRHAPDRLYIGVATADHLQGIRHFLSQAPYSTLLELTPDLHVQAI